MYMKVIQRSVIYFDDALVYIYLYVAIYASTQHYIFQIFSHFLTRVYLK